MFKEGLLILSWFVAGGLAFYALQLHDANASLALELASLQDLQQRYQEQVALNDRQREQFEVQIQQLQDNLRSSQAQMSNLSEALQETREMMEPAARQALEQLPGAGADPAQ